MTPEIGKIAKKAFADSFLFYLQAHYYHWNVEGRHFSQDHKLFQKIYEDVQEAIDKFAEELRAIGTYAPGVFDRFKELATIHQSDEIPTAEKMYSNLIDSNEKVLKSLDAAFDILEANHLHGFSNFIADRVDAHSKHGWMLKSTLKK
jgi:starvation-inducible DNA-binding protein